MGERRAIITMTSGGELHTEETVQTILALWKKSVQEFGAKALFDVPFVVTVSGRAVVVYGRNVEALSEIVQESF